MGTRRTLRSRLRGLAGGGAATEALAEHQAAITALQREIGDLRAGLDRSADDQRRATRDAVDDLAARLDVMSARLDALSARSDA